ALELNGRRTGGRSRRREAGIEVRRMEHLIGDCSLNKPTLAASCSCLLPLYTACCQLFSLELHLKARMNRLSKRFKLAPVSRFAGGCQSVLVEARRRTEMFTKSRKAVAAATLSVV